MGSRPCGEGHSLGSGTSSHACGEGRSALEKGAPRQNSCVNVNTTDATAGATALLLPAQTRGWSQTGTDLLLFPRHVLIFSRGDWIIPVKRHRGEPGHHTGT